MDIKNALEEKAQQTVEFEVFQGATKELFDWLLKYVPAEEIDELLKLLEAYSGASADLAQKMLEIAEEMADEE